MSGLLLKDIINLKQQAKIYCFIIVVWLIISLVNRDDAFFSMCMVLFSVMIPMSAIAYDDKAKWGPLCFDDASLAARSRDFKISAGACFCWPCRIDRAISWILHQSRSA